MKKILLVGTVLCLALQHSAYAETTGTLLSDVAGVVIDNSGFSENEKALIRDYYSGRGLPDSGYSSDNEERYRSEYERESEDVRRERERERYENRDDDDDDDRPSKRKGRKSKIKDKGKKKKGLPPGLAKRDSLPPGLQKQLEKNGTLPPGLAKRDLPYDLKRALRKRPDNQEVVVVDNDVVLLEKATGLIIDILRGGARAR